MLVALTLPQAVGLVFLGFLVLMVVLVIRAIRAAEEEGMLESPERPSLIQRLFEGSRDAGPGP